MYCLLYSDNQGIIDIPVVTRNDINLISNDMILDTNNCNSFDCVFNSDMDDLSSCVNYWIESLQIMDGGSLDATKLENLNFHATNFCKLQKQILGTYDTRILSETVLV